ncbi:MAG: sigma-70 family RNA polymerase sigma factor [Hyphomicrobiaceae bacterium]|nr:sigma-70 family RNA polymerase sigma factor [Hyphomicrobiaceae bacterium]
MPARAGEQRGHPTESGYGQADAAAAAADASLLKLAGLGDAAAFRGLVERHLPAVLAVARRMLRDDAEAEDVAQEALMRLWRVAADLDIGPAGARPWLRRVVSNLCIDRIRAVQRTEVTDEVPDAETEADQLRGLAEQDLSAHVDAALKQLPERQRLALTLFHYEGLSQIEIGEIMGVSNEAVESLLGRARRALKSALKENWRQLLWDPA